MRAGVDEERILLLTSNNAHIFQLRTNEDRVVFTDQDLAGGAVSADRKTLYVSRASSRVRRVLITNFDDRPR